MLFLIDGLGAILSAFLLGIVLVRLEHYFGIPSSTLYVLASIPILFAFYDLYCYNYVKNNLDHFLTTIAVMNITYCVLSLGIVFHHNDEITKWGWIYIVLEITIVLCLAVIEIQVAKHISKQDVGS